MFIDKKPTTALEALVYVNIYDKEPLMNLGLIFIINRMSLNMKMKLKWDFLFGKFYFIYLVNFNFNFFRFIYWI